VKKYTIDSCCSADLTELFSLFAQWFKFNPRMQEKEFFDWQFRDTPLRLNDGEYDFFVLRRADGRIDGCLGFGGFEFWNGKKIEAGGWTHNWHSESRTGGGLDLLLRFMGLVDNRFLLRLNEKSRSICDLLEIPVLEALPRWWAVVDSDQVVEVLGMRDTADRAILTRSANLLMKNCAPPLARRVERLDPDDEFRINTYGATNGVRRTGRYLNWRYVEIPKHDYRLLRTDEGLGVYRVVPIMGTDLSVIRLVEWTFAVDETAGALAGVIAESAGHKPILIDFHCTCSAVASGLEKLGFVSQEATKAQMPDLFRPTFFSGGYAVAVDLPPHRKKRSVDWDNWYITIGDSDIDRAKL